MCVCVCELHMVREPTGYYKFMREVRFHIITLV